MKRKYTVLGLSLALALSGLWSCEKSIGESEKIETGKSVTLTLRSDLAEDTRTSISYDEASGKYKPVWKENEHIGVFVSDNKNIDFESGDAGQTTQFIGDITLTAGTHNVYSYYPYDGTTYDKNTASDTRITLPTVQNPTLTSFDGAADIMVGYPMDLTLHADETAPLLEGLRFKRLMATLQIVPSDIASQIDGEPVLRMRLTAGNSESDAVLTGRVKIDLTSCEIHADGFYSSGNYKCNYVEASYKETDNFQLDGKNAAFMVVNPTTIASGKTLTLEIETANYKVTKTSTLPSDMTFTAGAVTPLRMNLAAGTTIESTSTGLTLPFEEDFADCTTGNNTSSSGSSTPWKGNDKFPNITTAYQAGGAVRLGKGGELKTVKLNLDQPFTVIVKGKGWSQTENTLTVSAGSQSQNCTFNSYMNTGDWESMYLYFDAINAASQVSFSTASDMRVFIDEIQILQGKVTPPAELVVKQKEIAIQAAGVTDAILSYTVNFDDDVEVECDGEVVTSAAKTANGTVTYTVSENTGDAEREGLIELSSKSTGLSVLITVTQTGANTASTYTVTYTVASTTSVTASGDVPQDASATFKNTYSTKDQLTKDKSASLTLSGFDGNVIKSIVMSMHSNGKSGAGSYDIKIGDNTVASQATANFNEWTYNTTYGTDYRDVDTHAAETTVEANEDITITIKATANSLYIQSYTLTYEVAAPSTDPTISADDITDVPATGVSDATTTYTVKNFTDDVQVSAFDGNVTAASSSAGTITYTVAPNYSGAETIGTITLSSASAPAVTINVKQAADVFEVSPASLTLGSSKDDIATFTVSSTYAWTVSTEGTGYTVSPAAGEAGQTEVTVTASADGASDEASLGTITVTRTPDSKTASVAVSQLAAGGSAQVWTLVEDATSLAVGDKIVIASNNSSKGTFVAGDISSSIMSSISGTFSTDKKTIPVLPANAVILTLGGQSGAWTLTNSDGKKLGATAAKKLAWGSGTQTWSIEIATNGDATIQNGTSSYGRFLYNVSSPRFAPYTSNTSASMLLPQIFKLQ